MQAPEEIVPRLAWRGRVTLLAAREKTGKSTFAAFGAALVSRESKDSVLWVNLEEAPFDVVDRFEILDADPDRVIVSEYLPNKLTDVETAITEHTPALLIIDTLAAWGAGRVTDWNSAAQVTPVMLELVGLARQYNVAIVILHHGKKLDGSYRDSSAIGASVDAIIEMSTDDKDDYVRKFKPRARWTVEPFSMRWTGTTYEWVDGETSIHNRKGLIQDQVYRHIEKHLGCSKNAIRKNVKGKATDIDRAIDSLIADGRIENRGGKTGASYCTLIDGEPETPRTLTGQGRDTPLNAPPKTNETLKGHGKDTPRDKPPVSHPLKGGRGDTLGMVAGKDR